MTDFCNWQFSDRILTDIWLFFETFGTYIDDEYPYVISTVIMLYLIYARDACNKALKIHAVLWHFSRHGDPRLHSELGSRDQHDQEHVQENEDDGKEKETT